MKLHVSAYIGHHQVSIPIKGGSIQGDSGGICETSENDSMCDSKQKSSYKQVSDFGRLRSYDRFLIPVHALV